MKKACSLILALVMTFALALPAEAAESATGTTLRLAEAKGTVTVKNASGKDVKTRDEMRLYNDYTVKTSKDSSAYIELDDSKAIQLDANSTVKIKKSGKQLEVSLTSGQIFFNVTKPLKSTETLNIRSANTITGVRGTAGVVTDKLVAILEGRVEVTILDAGTDSDGNPRSTEEAIAQVQVAAGQLLDIIEASQAAQEAAETGGELGEAAAPKTITADDIPAQVVEAIMNSPTFAEAVQEALPDLNLTELIESLPEKQAQEAQQAAEAEKQAQANAQEQTQQINSLNAADGTTGVVTDTQAFADAAAAATETPAPASTTTTTGSDSDSDSGSSSTTGGGSGSGVTSTSLLPTYIRDLDTAVNSYNRVTIPAVAGQKDVGRSPTAVGATEGLKIPTNTTLIIEGGTICLVDANFTNYGAIHVNSGAKLMLDGGRFDNFGTVNVAQGGELVIYTDVDGAKSTGTVANNGSINSGVANPSSAYLLIAGGKYVPGNSADSSGVRMRVSFKANGGVFGSGASEAYEVNRDVAVGSSAYTIAHDTAFANPTRNDYNFGGWYTAATGGTKLAANDSVTAPVVYYARWTQQTTMTVHITKPEHLLVNAYRLNSDTASLTLLALTDNGDDCTVSADVGESLWFGYCVESGWQGSASFTSTMAGTQTETKMGDTYYVMRTVKAGVTNTMAFSFVTGPYYEVSSAEGLSTALSTYSKVVFTGTGTRTSALTVGGGTAKKELLIAEGAKLSITVVGTISGASAGRVLKIQGGSKLLNYGTLDLTGGGTATAVVDAGFNGELANYGTLIIRAASGTPTGIVCDGVLMGSATYSSVNNSGTIYSLCPTFNDGKALINNNAGGKIFAAGAVNSAKITNASGGAVYTNADDSYPYLSDYLLANNHLTGSSAILGPAFVTEKNGSRIDGYWAEQDGRSFRTSSYLDSVSVGEWCCFFREPGSTDTFTYKGTVGEHAGTWDAELSVYNGATFGDYTISHDTIVTFERPDPVNAGQTLIETKPLSAWDDTDISAGDNLNDVIAYLAGSDGKVKYLIVIQSPPEV